MNKKTKATKSHRHPSVKNTQKPTYSHTFISCGKTEKKVLKKLIQLDGKRFNLASFSRESRSPRTSVYESLKSLKRKGYISQPYTGQHLITDQGKHFLEASGTYRTVCRKGDGEPSYIRDHKFTFELTVFDFPKGWQHQAVALLNDKFIQTSIQQFSKNNKLFHSKFPSDVDVIFTTRKIIIKPKNIFSNDHTEASTSAIAKCYEIIELLKSSGFGLLDTNNILRLIQKEGHYAEVNSLLGEWFEKHAKGFRVDNIKGKPLFWIDHSNGHREDETADETARDRLNSAMSDIMNNDLPKFSQMSEDLLSMKAITSDLVKLALIDKQTINKNIMGESDFKPDYFG